MAKKRKSKVSIDNVHKIVFFVAVLALIVAVVGLFLPVGTMSSENVAGEAFASFGSLGAGNSEISCSPTPRDRDGDCVRNRLDNCPLDSNPDQLDFDLDALGDVCDEDDDSDDIEDGSDNCPLLFNPDQENSDGDRWGDACDNCALTENLDQADSNNDGYGDACTCGDFVDPNLEEIVLTSAQSIDPSITEADNLAPDIANQITFLQQEWIPNRPDDEKVHSLDGVECLQNLAMIAIEQHKIQDLTPLSGLSQLERLYLSYGDISDISPLSELDSLTILHLWSNNIWDLSPIQDHPSIEYLSLGYNEVEDIYHLSGLTNLEELVLTNNDIQEVSAIGSLDLSRLILSYNIISDLSPTFDQGNLVQLEIAGSLPFGVGGITSPDLSFLSNFPSLELLDISDNNLDDISELSALGSLRIVFLLNNNLLDISVLSELGELRSVFLSNNPNLQDISPLLDVDELIYVNVRGSPLVDCVVVNKLRDAGVNVHSDSCP